MPPLVVAAIRLPSGETDGENSPVVPGIGASPVPSAPIVLSPLASKTITPFAPGKAVAGAAASRMSASALRKGTGSLGMRATLPTAARNAALRGAPATAPRSASSRFHVSVFATSSGVSHARRAVATAQR